MGGSGEAVDLDRGQSSGLRRGSMIHIDPETTYAIAAGDDGVSLVGGPSPPDPAAYEGVR
jgi:hypothetical protein